ncbi:MAG TPA: peptide deformylase [Solirubrobacteraceae bacterium]|nr:peptide deformylase [Solirubrobacteraceae bacterium]
MTPDQETPSEPLEEPATPPSQLDDVEVEREEGVPPVAELDEETRRRRDAALLQVRKFGDPVLRASAVPVERFDKQLKAEIERMTELMHDALGVGLAATQLGIVHRVLVYRADPEEPTTALVNPVLEWKSEETELAEEGCLSLPGVHVEVERALGVRVRAQDDTGAELELEVEGFPARIIQHEMDHLDGVLILDRISREERKGAMRAMRAAIEGREEPEAQIADDGAGETAEGADGSGVAQPLGAEASGA